MKHGAVDKKARVAIIGCGTYGSYLLKRLLETAGDRVEVAVIEVGDEKVRSEAEMGFRSESSFGRAAREGRYFGLGGTSARWGGQLLFFDRRDNPANDPDWQKIVENNQKYQLRVVENLIGKAGAARFASSPDNLSSPVKKGVWLKYQKRNLYKMLAPAQLARVRMLKNQRVTGCEPGPDGQLRSVICRSRSGAETRVEADVFYLTAGAMESCRLLWQFREAHGLPIAEGLGKNYGDHISVELFKILGHPPGLLGADMLPVLTGGNLITKRLVVASKSGQIGFAHAVLNKEVRVFSSIKSFLFGKQKVDFSLRDIITGVEFLFRFAFSVFFLKKMYAHRNRWSLQLDIEQPFPNPNLIGLSDTPPDDFGQKPVRVDWCVSLEDRRAIAEVQADLAEKLRAEGIAFVSVHGAEVGSSKAEDVYHPAGFMRMGSDAAAVLGLDCRVRGVGNLFHFSTAMFPSARSINSTGAGFCFIEAHLESFFDKKSTNFENAD